MYVLNTACTCRFLQQHIFKHIFLFVICPECEKYVSDWFIYPSTLALPVSRLMLMISEVTRDVHFHQKMQSVIAQKLILTLQVECLPS